jgi:hypothetical protein
MEAEPANPPFKHATDISYSFNKAHLYHSQMYISAHISDHAVVQYYQVAIPSFTFLGLFSLSYGYCDAVWNGS